MIRQIIVTHSIYVIASGSEMDVRVKQLFEKVYGLFHRTKASSNIHQLINNTHVGIGGGNGWVIRKD